MVYKYNDASFTVLAGGFSKTRIFLRVARRAQARFPVTFIFTARFDRKI